MDCFVIGSVLGQNTLRQGGIRTDLGYVRRKQTAKVRVVELGLGSGVENSRRALRDKRMIEGRRDELSLYASPVLVCATNVTSMVG